MPYNDCIPGQITLFQMRAIEIVSALVPERGKVVEVGSLFGSSSWCWAKSVHPSVAVHCIDPWVRNPGVASIEKRLNIRYGVEQFLAYTKDCPNIKAEQGYSPQDFSDWSDKIDLYYEDAVHVDPVLTSNLDFWTSHLKPAGIVCGDDYRPRFPDVRNGAARLAERLGRSLVTVENFWCLLPSDDLLPGAADVRRQLEDLSEQYRFEQHLRGPYAKCYASVSKLPTSEDEALMLDLQVEPKGIYCWPFVPGPAPLELIYSVARASEPDVQISWGSAQTPVDQIRPDMAEKFSVTIKDLPKFDESFIIDLVFRDPSRPGEPRVPLSRVMVRQAA